MKNDFNYKWSKLFASKRYNTKDGVIKLTPEEQQELLDDSKSIIERLDNERRYKEVLRDIRDSNFKVMNSTKEYIIKLLKQ